MEVETQSEKRIQAEVEILETLFDLDREGAITPEEKNGLLTDISDGALMKAMVSSWYNGEKAAAILKRRVRKWSNNQVVKLAEEGLNGDNDWQIKELAKQILVERMIRWKQSQIDKAQQARNPVVTQAALQADKKKKEINKARIQLGLKPIP